MPKIIKTTKAKQKKKNKTPIQTKNKNEIKKADKNVTKQKRLKRDNLLSLLPAIRH